MAAKTIWKQGQLVNSQEPIAINSSTANVRIKNPPLTIPPELPHSIGEWLRYYGVRIEAACTASTFFFSWWPAGSTTYWARLNLATAFQGSPLQPDVVPQG